MIGNYSSNFSIMPLPDPAHAGHAIAAGASGTLFTLTLSHEPGVPDLNFFGLDISVIASDMSIMFMNAGMTVGTMSGMDIVAAAGGILTDRTGQASLVTFLDQTGAFDQIVFANAGMFVSDNHVVGSIFTPGLLESTPVDESASFSIFGLGLVGAGTVRLWWKRVA